MSLNLKWKLDNKLPVPKVEDGVNVLWAMSEPAPKSVVEVAFEGSNTVNKVVGWSPVLSFCDNSVDVSFADELASKQKNLLEVV